MRWSGIAVLTLAQVAAVLAHPGSGLFKRAACNRDNCLRAVAAKSAAGVADCASFQTTTTTQCTATSTVFTTVTAATVTNSASTTTTSTTSETTTTETTTVTTAISTSVTTASFSDTTTVPTTVTASTTVFGYNPNQQANKKRQVGACGVAPAPHVTPTYVASCSGIVRYSSACSCVGVTATTITQATTTTTTTSTITVTPTVTSTSTSTIGETTFISTFTSVSTSVSSTTTVDISSTTATETKTTTATATPTDYVTFAVQVGPNPGTYLGQASGSNSAAFLTEALASAPKFTLDGTKLVLEKTLDGAIIGTGTFTPVKFLPITQQLGASSAYLSCTVDKTVSSNGGYPLTCVDTRAGQAPSVGANNNGLYTFQSANADEPYPVAPQFYAIAPYNAPAN